MPPYSNPAPHPGLQHVPGLVPDAYLRSANQFRRTHAADELSRMVKHRNIDFKRKADGSIRHRSARHVLNWQVTAAQRSMAAVQAQYIESSLVQAIAPLSVDQNGNVYICSNCRRNKGTFATCRKLDANVGNTNNRFLAGACGCCHWQRKGSSCSCRDDVEDNESDDEDYIPDDDSESSDDYDSCSDEGDDDDDFGGNKGNVAIKQEDNVTIKQEPGIAGSGSGIMTS